MCLTPASQACLDFIKSKCSDLGGCWVWGKCMYGLQPFMWSPSSKSRKPVRHEAWKSYFGTEPPSHLTCRFGTYGCVCPKHLVQQSHSQAIKAGLQRSPQGKLVQRKKNQLALRNFTPDQVQHILQRCMSQGEYAKHYGCHQSTISRVQNQTTNALPNPFLSLIN